MAKIFLVLFFIVVCSLHAGKAEESEEKPDNTEHTKNDDDEDESASIQVVQRDVVADKQDKSSEEHENNPIEEENYTETVIDTNSTKAEAKYDTFFEELIRGSGEIALENRNDNIEEVAIPAAVLNVKVNEYSNGQDKITIAIEDITKAYEHDEKSQEESVDEDENNWRSAEHFHSDEKKYADEAASEGTAEDEKDYSVEDYADKKIDLQVRGRMETNQPERRQQFNTRPMNARRYGPLENYGMLDSGTMRNYGEMVNGIPQYRPVLTRNGIVYTPTLYPTQTVPSLLDRLTGRNNWIQNRVHNMNPEAEAFKQRHNRVIGIPQYEDSKMMDDYNDYGPNTNTYSYTPVRKATTQAPPQQIASPNKFDVFQKLLEASNHPKSQKRTFNEFPGNYHAQRQYPENFGSFNVRRVRRYAWDEPPFQDI